jgi:1,4-dihydroxy-2-naphthoate polyprenyltransferase
MKPWLQAARLRTLPLALSSILMGCFLAAASGQFSWKIALLAVFTTVFLQVLSNFANDYGDAVSGKDTDARQGPKRAVQSGAITAKAMKKAMILMSALSFSAGCWLLYEALHDATWQTFATFLGLGVLAIIAAITYTAGKRPYGYVGLGDISVLLFFGWVGVLGAYYLHTQSIDWTLLLPATSCGLLAVGVLNINNIRDIESDTLTGKKSIPVRIGRKNAIVYHWFLLITAMICAVVFLTISSYSWGWVVLLSFPLFLRNGLAVSSLTDPRKLDPYLKQMALSTLLFVILLGVGCLL